MNARLEMSDMTSMTIEHVGDRYRVGIEHLDEPGPWVNCSGAWISLSAADVDRLCEALYDALEQNEHAK